MALYHRKRRRASAFERIMHTRVFPATHDAARVCRGRITDVHELNDVYSDVFRQYGALPEHGKGASHCLSTENYANVTIDRAEARPARQGSL